MNFKQISTSNRKVWFTSDWHLSHANIIKYAKRPFVDVEHMNTTILNNAHRVIGVNDYVFFLGDFCFHTPDIEYIIQNLPGKEWIWISGNHEKPLKQYLHSHNMIIYDLLDIVVDTQPITLCHYPMVSWNKSHYGAWQLFGHHHSLFTLSNSYVFEGKKMNVCTDLYNYYPIDFEFIKNNMHMKSNNWDYIDKENKHK